MEESFNLQACYDLLYKPWSSVSEFDHVEFPGVVPRTFIGPILLSFPVVIMKRALSIPPFIALHLIRITLGTMTVLSLLRIRTSVSQRFGNLAGTLFTLLTVTQFHILFYASRTLPNVFALILTNLAAADRLCSAPFQRPYRAIVTLSVACALFRSELCILIFWTLVVDLYIGRLDIFKSISHGIVSAVSTAVTSITIDSYFWRRLCYPELEVFYFNVVLNKSSDWGTSPFHWYFSNALPRSLGGAYLLAVYGLMSKFKQLGAFMLPSILFVLTYSALPHKELRFIFYAVPVFNVAAAVVSADSIRLIRAWIYDKSEKDVATKSNTTSKNKITFRLCWTFAVCLLLAGTLGLSLLMSMISSVASHGNYPAGLAMRHMHDVETSLYERNGLCQMEETSVALVHIDANSAMNGISQFVQQSAGLGCPRWQYSKREDVEGKMWNDFSHLVSANASVNGFCVFHVEDGYAGLDIKNRRLKAAPRTYVHRNTAISRIGCLEGS